MLNRKTSILFKPAEGSAPADENELISYNKPWTISG